MAGVLGAGLVMVLASRARSRARDRARRREAAGRAAWHDPVSRARAWSPGGEPAVPGVDGLRTGPHGRLVMRRRAGVVGASPDEPDLLEPVGGDLFGAAPSDAREPVGAGPDDDTRGA